MAVENGGCESLVLLFANTNDIQFFVKKVRVLNNFTFFNALIRPFFINQLLLGKIVAVPVKLEITEDF